MQYEITIDINTGLYGIEDENKNIIIPCIYEHIILSYFEEIELIIVCEDSLWGLINIKGEIIIPYKYRYISLYDFKKTGLIIIRDKNGLYSLINIKDELLIPYGKYCYIMFNNIVAHSLNNRSTYYFIKNDKILLYKKNKIYAV